MTIVRHELRQGKNALLIWTGAIVFLLVVCVFFFPEMKGEMDAAGELFAGLGGFTAAFGMDRLNFGTFTGFYAIECGNVLGLGGAFFAALVGVTALSREEGAGTAEFLLTHPVSRTRVLAEKLAAVLLEIGAMNLVILAASLLSIAAIGEEIREILLLHLAYFLLQLELAGICFGISAFLRRGGTGIGLGLAAMLYFLNLIANMTESAAFLKYVTPFGYCDGADIVDNGALDAAPVAAGMVLALAGIAAAFGRYCRKDIH